MYVGILSFWYWLEKRIQSVSEATYVLVYAGRNSLSVVFYLAHFPHFIRRSFHSFGFLLLYKFFEKLFRNVSFFASMHERKPLIFTHLLSIQHTTAFIRVLIMPNTLLSFQRWFTTLKHSGCHTLTLKLVSNCSWIQISRFLECKIKER